MKKSTNIKAVILATDGFEQSEFEKPLEALKDEGIEVDIVSLKKGKIKGWKEKNWGDEFEVDKSIDNVSAEDYDLLVLPGGVMNPDALRTNEDVIDFVNSFFEQKKIIAAICHAPWTLIETGKVKGKQMTSFKSIKTDLTNAGAIWKDEEVVVDSGLITSRSPEDLKAFCKKIIEEIKEQVPA
ncbi:MAG: type 1 glutamine amidotransferase domain-containing protein [Bacteroidia bacterium]